MSSLYGTVKHGDEISPAWMQNVEDGIGGGNPAQAATYTVFKDGSYYKARNGLTGKIDFDNSVWEELMNTTILDIYDSAAGAGSIWLKDSCYTATGQVNMRPGIYINGTGWPGNVTSSLAGIWGGTTIETQGTDTTIFSFDFPAPLTSHYCCGLHRLFLIGPEYDALGTSTKPLIDMQCNNNYLSDVWITDTIGFWAKYGLRIYNNAAATYKIWNIFVDKCMWEDNEYEGLLIDSPTNQIIERVRVTNCHFYGNCKTAGNGGLSIGGHSTYAGVVQGNCFDLEQQHSIYMEDEADHWALLGNIIKDGGAVSANTKDGISLNDVDYISVNGNVAGDVATSNLRYAYVADNNCTYLAVLGNVFTGVTGGASFGTGTGNIGDATMNVVKTE